MAKKVIFGIVALLVLLGLVSQAQPTAAGTNGQQLQLYVSCQYAPASAEVRVSGLNQNNQYVSWYARLQPTTRSVVTAGWWWKGTVQIQYKYTGINPYTGYPYSWYGTSAYVPTTYNQNIYAVAVDQGLACRPAP